MSPAEILAFAGPTAAAIATIVVGYFGFGASKASAAAQYMALSNDAAKALRESNTERALMREVLEDLVVIIRVDVMPLMTDHPETKARLHLVSDKASKALG